MPAAWAGAAARPIQPRLYSYVSAASSSLPYLRLRQVRSTTGMLSAGARKKRRSKMVWVASATNIQRLTLLAVIFFVIALVAWGCFALPAPRSSLRNYSVHGKSGQKPLRLIDIIPNDLDVLRNDRVIGALGAQLLLFGGFDKSAAGEWERSASPPQTLQDRVARITPTWKQGGLVDYTYYSRGAQVPLERPSLFGDALNAGTSVAELVAALEEIGLEPEDFDGPARAALSTMLTWELPSDEVFNQGLSPPQTMLIFSFDATPACLDLRDCPLPGPTNELLAATAARFFAQIEREHGQQLHIIAQWEVAAAILHFHGETVPPERVREVGTPGEFENTGQIFGQMMCELAKQSTGKNKSNALVLAHPDHLRRVMSTVHKLQKTTRHGRLRGCQLSTSVQLYSAMQPYNLEWPFRESDSGHSSSLYHDVKAKVHTGGGERMASWYDSNLGFFPDGEPQRWVHSREVWLLYDHWAMAKGIATGVLDGTNIPKQGV